MPHVSPTNSNREDIVLKVYDVSYAGQSVGFTDSDSVEVSIGGRMVSKGVDQVSATIAKAHSLGQTASIKMVLSAADIDFANEVLLNGQTEGRTDANGTGYGLGSKTVDMDTVADELYIIPSDNAVGDLTSGFKFHKAFVNLAASPFIWKGQKEGYQSLSVQFDVLPDFDEEKAYQLGIMGNAGVVETAPDKVFIQFSKSALAPYKQPAGLTLGSGGKSQAEAFGFWKGTQTQTAALNDATDINSTDTAITYDTLSTGSAIASGSVLKIGSEWLYVTSATSTVATCVRGIFGSTPASALDDAAIEVYSAYYIRKITDVSTWASSSTGDFTVGNTAGVNGDTAKGRIVWIADGSGNATATLLAVASSNLAITTNA